MQKNLLRALKGFSQDKSSCPEVALGLLVLWNLPSMTTDPVNCTGEQHKKQEKSCEGIHRGHLQSPTFLAIICNVVKPENFQVIYKHGMQTTEGAKYFPTLLKER